MRAPSLALILALAACAPRFDEVANPPPDGELADELMEATNLSELMLAVGDPADSVAYFQQAYQRNPGRVDLKRGYARSLSRAGRHSEAARAFEALVQAGEAADADHLEYAQTLTRLERWDAAETQLARISPSLETPRRYLLAAMVSDHRGSWVQADQAYEQARLAAPNPAPVLNNWGVSKMSRGDFEGAVKIFEEALVYDPGMFSAKNNLTISRAKTGDYRLPVVTVTDAERARLYHNLGVVALQNDDVAIAKGLFGLAVEAHPRAYPEAREKLRALEAIVAN